MSSQQKQQRQFASMPPSDDSIFRLPPYFYIHVLDLNKNVTRVEIGPQTYVRQDNERIILAPTQMITVPPRYYCVVKNPIIPDESGNVQVDKNGQVLLAHADSEVRLTRDPFPLYPGEELIEPPTQLKVVAANSALRLRSVLDFDDNGVVRVAGDEWLFEGPGTYIPRKEVKIVETINATIILPNQALKLRARLECKDRAGQLRVSGEEWLVKKIGAYLPGAYEEVVEKVDAFVLTDKKALHTCAKKNFKDQLGVDRRNGEEWLVTMQDAETYIPDVYEEVVEVIDITTLSNRQYCVVLNPVGDDGRPQLGKRRLMKGERSFFLRPGETLESGIQNVYVLGEDEGLILRATEAFHDAEQKIDRSPGDRWMLRGPAEYVPPVEVQIVTARSALPLDENEGIYVRDIKTGRVRAVIGRTYMLTQDEVLWPKELPEKVETLLGFGVLRADQLQKARGGSRWDRDGVIDTAMSVQAIGTPASFGMTNVMQQQIQSPVVQQKTKKSSDFAKRKKMVSFGLAEEDNYYNDEELYQKDLPSQVENLLSTQRDPLADRGERGEGDARKAHKRDKTKVVTFRVPHNAAVQIYDYKEKKARVVFGPDLVMLMPDEHFTQLSLSGGKPKRPNVIKSLCLLMGPDFCTDIITVETADHARLQLQLSYNWHFKAGDRSETIAAQLFSVPDFVGDACKAIASRVRGMVAQVQFDDFHKNSARIIRTAVFGLDEKKKVKDEFVFPQNNLVITSVDIQSVEPVDQRTRDALQKSVQLAIEITTNSQEATAKHEAERLEQEARGKLERQRIHDQAEAEKSRKELLQLQAMSAATESTGQAKAEAQSRAESARIEGEAAVEQAKLKAQATQISTDAELVRLERAREAELKYTLEQNNLEVKKATEMCQIEIEKFQRMVGALGADTIRAIATSGPETQVKLLQSLGLQTALITDGSSPINLFNAANGLIGGIPGMGRGSGKKKAKIAPVESDESDDED